MSFCSRHHDIIASIWMMVVITTCLMAPCQTVEGASWWPSVLLSSGNTRKSSDDDAAGSAAPTGSHSAYLASKSDELEQMESSLLVEVRRRAQTSPCWKDAVSTLEARCGVELQKEDQRSRLALRFAACQLHHDGKILLNDRRSPQCPDTAMVTDCIGSMEDALYPLYIQFRLHVDALCFHAQEELFQERAEMAVIALDRAATSSLARYKELRSRSTEMAAAMEDARRVQQDVLGYAKTTAQWLQDQHTAQQEALRTMTATVADATARVQGLQSTFTETHSTQLVALEGVRTELATVATWQEAASDTAKSLAGALDDLANTSAQHMHRHHDEMEKIAQHTRQMALDAAEQQQTFMASHASMIDMLERLFVAQRAIAGGLLSMKVCLFYVTTLIAILVLTSALPRVAGCRGQAVLVLTMGCAVDAYGVPRDVIAPWIEATTGWECPPHYFHTTIAWVLFALLCHAAWVYVTPQEQQRKAIRAELQQWWSEVVASCSPQGMPPSNGIYYWDQGDQTVCDAVVWSPPTTNAG